MYNAGICDGGRCSECKYDYQCASDEYCRYNNLPGIENKCTTKKDNGQTCLQDRVGCAFRKDVMMHSTLSLKLKSFVLLYNVKYLAESILISK